MASANGRLTVRGIAMRAEEEIRRLVKEFEDCTLPKAEWTHGAHMTVALCYLLQYGQAKAVERMRRSIQRFNAANGNSKGYHETITLAWMTVIAGFLATRRHTHSIAELVCDLLAECGDKNYLLRHYSRDRLLSDAARREWLPPD